MPIEKMNATFPLCHRIFFQLFPIFSPNVHITTAENGTIIITFSMHSVVSFCSPFTVSQMPQPPMTSDKGFSHRLRFSNVLNNCVQEEIRTKCGKIKSQVLSSCTSLRRENSYKPCKNHYRNCNASTNTISLQNRFRLCLWTIQYEYNNIDHLFFSIFHDSTNRYDVGVISGSDSVLNSSFRR